MANDAAINITLRMLDQATSPMRNSLDQINGRLRATESAMGLVGKAGIAMFAGWGAKAVLTELISVNMQFERLGATMRTIEGSAAGGDAGMAFVSEQAKRLGMDLISTADAYKNLNAASKGTTLEGKATQDIFKAVAQASSVLGLSTDDTSGALRAISQMMSKGKVMAEELRGQLGERLPAAFSIAAKAVGVTTAELDDMMRAGRVLPEDFIPKFTKALDERFSKSVLDAANTTEKSVNRMRNAWNQLASDFTEGSGLSAGFKWIVNQLTEVLTALDEYPARLRVFGDTFRNTLNLRMATKEANRPIIQPTPWGDTYAGIGGGYDAPTKRVTWTPGLLENDLGAAADQARIASIEGAVAAQKQLDSAIQQSLSPLQKYNQELKEYDDLIAKGAKISPEQLGQLKASAAKRYQKSIEKGAGPSPVAFTDIDKQIQSAQKQIMDSFQVITDASAEMNLQMAEQSGDFLKAGEIRYNERAAKAKLDFQQRVEAEGQAYLELEQKLAAAKGGATPEAYAGLETLRQSVEALKAGMPGYNALVDQAAANEKKWAAESRNLRGAMDLAQVNSEYAQLTGTMKDQYQAQLALIQASEAEKLANLDKNVPGLAEAYQKLYAEQKRVAGILGGDDFFAGFAYGLQDASRSLQTMGQLGHDVALEMRDGFKDVFKGIITGADDMQERLSNLFDRLSDKLMDFVMDSLWASSMMSGGSGSGFFSGIASFLGMGGGVSTGGGDFPYKFGGTPTLGSGITSASITPRAIAGSRTSENRSGGTHVETHVHVNVQGGGNTGGGMDKRQADDLGRMVGDIASAKVKEVLRKESRPGGDLNSRFEV